MIYLLIPAFNESANIPSLLENISRSLKKKYSVIFVNDGSSDKTVETVKKQSKKYPVKIIGYKINKGPGSAFRYGFNYLIPKLKVTDLVITMESDNTCDFSILDKMIKKADKFDVVLSSPFALGGKFVNVSVNRRLLTTVANNIDGVVFRLKNVKTYSSFFRVYKATILMKAKKAYGDKLITEDNFPAVVELLIKLNKVHSRVTEVPSILNWSNRKGKSKLKIKKNMLKRFSIYINYFQGKYDL